MIAAFLARWITPYLVWGLAALLAAAVAFGGVQTLRLSSLRAQTAEDQREASQRALSEYQALALSLDAAASKLLTTQQERDDALKRTGRKVNDYIRRPGAGGICLDDDGLRIVADLATGTATDPGSPAGPVSISPASTD